MARGRRVKRERVEGGLRQGCIEGEPQTLPLSSLSLASSQHTPLRFRLLRSFSFYFSHADGIGPILAWPKLWECVRSCSGKRYDSFSEIPRDELEGEEC